MGKLFSSQALYIHTNHFVLLFLKGIIRGNITRKSKHALHCFQVCVLCVSCQLQVLFSLPSSQRTASQKVGHLDTFQSSSGRGTHSLHIILLLLFPPGSLFSCPLLAPHSLSCSLYRSSSLFQKPNPLWSFVRR